MCPPPFLYRDEHHPKGAMARRSALTRIAARTCFTTICQCLAAAVLPLWLTATDVAAGQKTQICEHEAVRIPGETTLTARGAEPLKMKATYCRAQFVNKEEVGGEPLRAERDDDTDF